MSDPLLGTALMLAQVLLALAMACAFVRLVRGPRAQDRVLAFDTMYVNGMLLALVVGMRDRDPVYFEVGLGIALLGFVSTAALAKFLLRGEVVE